MSLDRMIITRMHFISCLVLTLLSLSGLAAAAAEAPLTEGFEFRAQVGTSTDVQTARGPSLSEFRRWPPDKSIRVSYRIIGSYADLIRRLQPAITYPNGVEWGPPLDVLAQVNVEQILIRKIKTLERLTGLNISIRKINWWDGWWSSIDPADIHLQFYLSDSYGDLGGFPGIRSLHERLINASQFEQRFIPWGWVGIFNKGQRLQGAACLATYSAMTFREELALDLAIAHGMIERGRRNPPIIRPFEKFLVDYWLGGWGHIFEHRGPATHGNKWINKNLNKSGKCRKKFRKMYETQWSLILDSCLSTALGIPASDVTLRALLQHHESVPFFNPRYLEYHKIGSQEWVHTLGRETVNRRHESDYFLFFRNHHLNMISRIYNFSQGAPDQTHEKLLLEKTIDPQLSISDLNIYEPLKPCFLRKYGTRGSVQGK